MEQSENELRRYVLVALKEICNNGDAYVTEDTLYKVCKARDKALTYGTFRNDLVELIRCGSIHREGTRLYAHKTWCYEEEAARSLAKILRNPKISSYSGACEAVAAGKGVVLCEEQREAVSLACSNRLSMILGGAGCGKSTLVQAIVTSLGQNHRYVLCAPTGKAARNLTERTGLTARTIHSALGLQPMDDFLTPVRWNVTELVIVDESSMMTLEMLAGILCRAGDFCRVVLLGDPNQLLSVGAGNVLCDLLKLQIPHIFLRENHRQRKDAQELLDNVTGFDGVRESCELKLGGSFELRAVGQSDVSAALMEEAVKRYLSGESVQVLSPYNKATSLSVQSLNEGIRQGVNPPSEVKAEIIHRGRLFREGDRVMILKNDREKNCCNGDMGILHILQTDEKCSVFCVILPDGRCPMWEGNYYLELLSLAYALTVHKAQGSEFDTVLFPACMEVCRMLSRNLFYTAISRARKQVILYGDMEALNVAVTRSQPERRSMLVPKTHMLGRDCKSSVCLGAV